MCHKSLISCMLLDSRLRCAMSAKSRLGPLLTQILDQLTHREVGAADPGRFRGLSKKDSKVNSWYWEKSTIPIEQLNYGPQAYSSSECTGKLLTCVCKGEHWEVEARGHAAQRAISHMIQKLSPLPRVPSRMMIGLSTTCTSRASWYSSVSIVYLQTSQSGYREEVTWPCTTCPTSDIQDRGHVTLHDMSYIVTSQSGYREEVYVTLHDMSYIRIQGRSHVTLHDVSYIVTSQSGYREDVTWPCTTCPTSGIQGRSHVPCTTCPTL